MGWTDCSKCGGRIADGEACPGCAVKEEPKLELNVDPQKRVVLMRVGGHGFAFDPNTAEQLSASIAQLAAIARQGVHQQREAPIASTTASNVFGEDELKRRRSRGKWQGHPGTRR